MDLKILAGLITYYVIISFLFLFSGTYFGDTTTNINLNVTDISDAETEPGFFDVLPDIGRFASFITFGITFDETIPDILKYILIAWQSSVTLFTLGFVISAIWDG